MFKTIGDGKLPTRGSKFSACVDLYASESITIGAGETKLVGLGVAIDINRGFFDDYALSIGKKDDGMDFEEYYEDLKEFFYSSHYLQLMLRSSLGKKGLILPNGVGVIDMDYKDEIKMIIHNPMFDKLKALETLDTDYDDGGNYEFHEESDNILLGFSIKKGERIAQITLLEHKSYLFGIESEEERTGGFGSTNKKDNHV